MATPKDDKARAKLAREFMAEWAKIEDAARGADYDRAKLVSNWAPRLGGLDECAEMLTTDAGLGPPRVGKILKQMAALGVLPNRSTWTALGWSWVSRLASVEDESERRRIEKALLNAADLHGGILQDGAVKKTLQEIGAEDLLPQKGARKSQDDIFRAELVRLVRSGILPVEKVDPYVAKMGRLAELVEAAKN